MKIIVEKANEEKLKSLGVKSWPLWTKEKSKFDWEYDSEEICYILEGEVIVTDSRGEKTKFGKGDLVTFPKGLKCQWEILKDVRKHYHFQ